MKILSINNFHYLFGGASVVYFNTSELLRSKGHEVLNFSTHNDNNLGSSNSEFFAKNQNFRNTNFLSKFLGAKNYIYNRDAQNKLENLIQKYNPEIAHIHLFYGGLTSSILKTLKKYNIPSVISVHDYRLLCPANAFLNSENDICEKCKNKCFYQCSQYKCLENNFFYSTILSLEAYTRKYFIDPLEYINHFIFVSEFSRNKHIEFDKRYSTKSTHIYNFNILNDKNPSNTKGEYFLYYGRLSKEKGISTLLIAAEKTGIKLKIAGTGPLKEEVENYCLNSSNIEYVGHRSGEELINLIRSASFIIVPSEWYENNPMTIIEAYSLGKPVIGSKIGGIPEIIVDNVTGYLFESRNIELLIQQLINATNLKDKDYLFLSNNAVQFSQSNFSSEVHYSKLLNTYNSILHND